MEAVLDSMLQSQLVERREKLQAAVSQNGGGDFARLLSEVDSALRRLEDGTYGICDECHDPVETDRLLADPLMTLCLDHLTARQRRLLEDDLTLASSIQRALLPQLNFNGSRWTADFVYQPAGIVSGDYCDVIAENGDLYFVLGDVSGKGMAASLLMSNLQAMFHALIPLGLSLPELMTRANRIFGESTLANQYATLICGKANENGEIEICNAGHLPPVVMKNGETKTLPSTGLPLGMFCESSFETESLKLEAGESILLYTDGAVETFDADGAEFGVERLIQTLNGGAAHPSEIMKSCVEAISGHRGGGDQADDLTLLALQFGRNFN